MRKFIGRLFDSLGVVLAAVLTICGFLLLFMPWKQALSIKIVDAPCPHPTSATVPPRRSFASTPSKDGIHEEIKFAM